MTTKLKVPTFAHGTYPSADGTPVKFDDALMRKLERNTNFLIANKILTPPVEYDWIDDAGKYHHGGMSAISANERTDAHGAIERVTYEDGVVHLHYANVSDKLAGDIKAGKRIRSSGVFVPNYWYNDALGKKVEIGPAVVGTAVLGSQRPAMRNPKIVPLSELQFGEEVSVDDALHLREQLRASGLVAQTFDEDRYCFSEIEIDPKIFGEPKEEQHMPMTDAEKAEFQNMINSAVNTATAPLIAKNKELEQQVQKFSETAKIETEAKAFCETLVADRKQVGAALPALFVQHGQKMLCDPEFSDAQREAIRKLMQLAPSALVQGGKGGENQGDEIQTDEPKALSELRPKHFATREDPTSQQKIVDGLAAFSEFRPGAFNGIEGDPAAQTAKLHAYITTRDTVS